MSKEEKFQTHGSNAIMDVLLSVKRHRLARALNTTEPYKGLDYPVETLIAPEVETVSQGEPPRLPKLMHSQAELNRPLTEYPDGKPRINPSNAVAKTEASMGGLPELKVDKHIARENTQAELHRGRGETWWCLEGEVQFVVGGTMVEPHFYSKDGLVKETEIRSDTVSGGTRYTLRKGDMLYIPEGMPHIHWTETAAKLWFIKHPANKAVALQSPGTPEVVAPSKAEVFSSLDQRLTSSLESSPDGHTKDGEMKNAPLSVHTVKNVDRNSSNATLQLSASRTIMCVEGELEIEVSGKITSGKPNSDEDTYLLNPTSISGGVKRTMKHGDTLYVPEGHTLIMNTKPHKAARYVTWITATEKVSKEHIPGWNT